MVLATGGEYRYDAASQSFYVVKGNQWISVEKAGLSPEVPRPSDPPMSSIARKAIFIIKQGLGGAMFWEVGFPSCNPRYIFLRFFNSVVRFLFII